MRGQVLNFSIQTSSGLLTTPAGERFTFTGADWMEPHAPTRGMAVDFQPEGPHARAIYQAQALSRLAPGGKDRLTAGLLALFLGGFGAHKFYLGFYAPGLIYLLINTIGWLVTWLMFCLPNYALFALAVIEGILYLTRTDEEFHQLYVVQRKPWL